jgi:hypothetical protein
MAVDLKDVMLYTEKATKLIGVGHFARAAEAYGADAAERFKQPDCLIAALLRLEQADAICLHSTTPEIACLRGGEHLQLQEQAGALMAEPMAAMSRRKDAGTLLAGCCRRRR